jgi:CRISPR-associated protein Cas2
MAMTVIVTRDVEDRYRGFLSSAMLEIAPGVYTSPRLTKAVRNRVWTVLGDWFNTLGRGSIVMTWRDPGEPGGQGLLSLGEPPRSFVELDGLLLIRKNIAGTTTP